MPAISDLATGAGNAVVEMEPPDEAIPHFLAFSLSDYY